MEMEMGHVFHIHCSFASHLEQWMLGEMVTGVWCVPTFHGSVCAMRRCLNVFLPLTRIYIVADPDSVLATKSSPPSPAFLSLNTS